jgi:hypothetical protein
MTVYYYKKGSICPSRILGERSAQLKISSDAGYEPAVINFSL